MRKFITASIAAATLMAGATVPTAAANPVEKIINAFTCGAAEGAVKQTGAKTKGELKVLLNRKTVDELRTMGFFTGNMNVTEQNKPQLISNLADKALECKLVEEGIISESSALMNNTSSVTKKTLSSQTDEEKAKDVKDFSFGDIFNAFSSGISS